MEPIFFDILFIGGIAFVILLATLFYIIKNQETIMATLAQFEAALARIDAATTDIAADLQALKDQIAGAGLSSEVESEVLAKLEAAASKLEGIGGSVENPVPDETTPDTGEGTEPTETEEQPQNN